jgi:hypothetical protein
VPGERVDKYDEIVDAAFGRQSMFRSHDAHHCRMPRARLPTSKMHAVLIH